MAEYGLTLTGFVPKTLEVIRNEINVDLRTTFGQNLDLSDADPLGQLVGLVSSHAAELWELGEAIYNSQNRDTATGVALDDVLLLTGTFRQAATPSSVTLFLTGTNATTVPEDSQAETLSAGLVFSTTDDALLATATSYANGAFVVGDVVTNTTRIYYCTEAGTGNTAPTGTSSAIDAGGSNPIWRYVGEGAAYASVSAVAVETGPNIAIAGDITVITTPVGGWSSVMNVADADPGQDIATDAEARLQGEIDLATAGESTINAIKQELLTVENVLNVTIFSNTSDLTDADGVPPHSIEALIQVVTEDDAETEQAIWDKLLDVVSATSGTYGDEIGTAEDTSGNSHTMAFSYPEQIPIYIEITLIKDPNTYPTDGDDQIKAAVAAYFQTFDVGKNAVASSIGAQAFSITGVLDVVTTKIDDAPTPTVSTTVAISNRQLAIITDSDGDIDIITSDGTP